MYLIIGPRQIPLREGENIIGRELIGTPDVSRHHARILVKGLNATVEDLDSKNGTFTHGKRLESAMPLDNYQEIVFGRTRAIIRFAGPSHSTMTADPLSGNHE